MQVVGGALGEPDHARVVAEVVVAQLGVAVEPERPDDEAVERADEEVGQEEDARLVPAAVDLVAVGAVEAAEAVEVGAAVGVGDDDVVPCGRVFDGGPDPLRPVVQLGRDGADVQVPAAPLRDPLDLERERSAGDDGAAHRLHSGL